MAAGETGDHGPPSAPPTVCKEEKGPERGQKRAPILHHKEMDLTVQEQKLCRRIVVRNIYKIIISLLRGCSIAGTAHR